MVPDPVVKYCKNGSNADMFFQVLEKQGKNLLWANEYKTIVAVDWRPPKRRFESEEKTFKFEYAC